MNGTTTMDEKIPANRHGLPDRLFGKVWIGLLFLTAATVSASVFVPGPIGIAVALVVTPTKAALILLYFMHLKYESTGYKVMFLSAVGILAIFMGLTFFDYLKR